MCSLSFIVKDTKFSLHRERVQLQPGIISFAHITDYGVFLKEENNFGYQRQKMKRINSLIHSDFPNQSKESVENTQAFAAMSEHLYET